MNSYHDLIIQPVVTEKSTKEKEERNKILFKVTRSANKIEVKKAVEEVFKVKVDKVHILNVKGKIKRLGRSQGKRSDWKKAIVTLKKGERVEFM